MYGVLEVKGIAPFVLLTQFIEKQVFIMSSYILNFNRYSSSHSVIPLTIFTVISPNISSDLDLVVSSGRGLSFHVEIFISISFNTFFSYPVYCVIFSWIDILPSTGQDIFSSLGFCIVST